VPDATCCTAETFAANAVRASGLCAVSRASSSVVNDGGVNACGSSAAVTCAAISRGRTGWLKRNSTTMGLATAPPGRYQLVCSSFTVGVVKRNVTARASRRALTAVAVVSTVTSYVVA
jgi:hypothetical protein